MKKLLIAFAALLAVSCSNYSDGYRIGTLNKFSYRGFIWKTWEGEMSLGGFRKGDDGGAVANLWEFSLDGKHLRGENVDELAKALTDAAETGKRIKVYYRQDYTMACSRGDSNYFVQKVEVLE